ncbi:MAG: rRNA-intervening sequence protein, partial [Bacteroidota bacterium]
MNIHNFRELKICQKSRFLAKDLHPIILTFPKYEIYGMMSQMQRAS